MATMNGGKAGGKGDLDQARFGVAVGRGGFVIEEAFKKMTDQQRELAALRRARDAERRLGVQREGLRLGHHEEALEMSQTWAICMTSTICCATVLRVLLAQQVARRRFQDSAGSSVWSVRRAARRPESCPWQ